MPKFNRRQFLGSTAAAAAFAAAPAIVQAAVVEKKVDLVIVGGGLAGLAAANAAVKKGVKPIVLEKEAFLGGAGLFPEGSLGVGTRYQKEHGIKTTVQQVLDAALQFHHYRCDPAVLRVLIEESRQTIDEIQDMGTACVFFLRSASGRVPSAFLTFPGISKEYTTAVFR